MWCKTLLRPYVGEIYQHKTEYFNTSNIPVLRYGCLFSLSALFIWLVFFVKSCSQVGMESKKNEGKRGQSIRVADFSVLQSDWDSKKLESLINCSAFSTLCL